MSEHIEQRMESVIEVNSYEHLIGISQPILGGSYDNVYCERESISDLILALLKLNHSSIPEVLKGIEEMKKL